MNGIIVINKPKGCTSHDIVQHMRRILQTKRVGHLGTLDPDATGVLAICVNEATKLVQFLEYDYKTYQVCLCLGIATDTEDLTGEPLDIKPVAFGDITSLDAILPTFVGKSQQIPPIYSAIKVNGKKLYQYARNQEQVILPERTIEVRALKRLQEPYFQDQKAFIWLEVVVSKGTYIRSLCRDLGLKLGLPGCMAELIRTKSGMFDLTDAYTVEQVINQDYQFVSMMEALQKYPIIRDSESIDKAKHGMKLSPVRIYEILNEQPQRIVIAENQTLIGIYDLNLEQKYYKAVRVWN